MPRTSRTVAQRLASQTKSRKRRATRPGEASPIVEQILDEVVPEPADVTEPAELRIRPRIMESRPAVNRAAPVRRRYAEYGDEYRYIWGDLRRIALVVSGLLFLLILLSFVIA